MNRRSYEIPGLPAGVVFIHDENDHIKGSIACGCLKLAWRKGDCQGSELERWCAKTHIFPDQLIDDKRWFKPTRNPYYTAPNGKKRQIYHL